MSLFHIEPKGLKVLLQLAVQKRGTLLEDFLATQQQSQSPPEQAQLSVSMSNCSKGAFKTSHSASRLVMAPLPPGSSYPPGHLRDFDIVAKRPYQAVNGSIRRYDGQRELEFNLKEGNILLWASALLSEVYEFMMWFIGENGPCEYSIPNLRFVRAAIATSVSRVPSRSRSALQPPQLASAVTSSHLLEEKIDGAFVKYIHNADAGPNRRLTPDDEPYYHIAVFLSFTQHAQYHLTGGLAFVSDYQGEWFSAWCSLILMACLLRRERVYFD